MAFVAELVVEPYLSGKRIDTFLSRHFRNYNTWRLMRLVRAGAVTVDGLRAQCDQRVWRGQQVRVALWEPPDKLLAPEATSLEILYEDPWLLVVNKPVDQVAHPAGEIHGGTLANAVQAHLDRQTPCKGVLRPGIVHRLDRFTSGVVIVAKDHLSHRRIQQQFEHRRVQKTYLAIVRGVVAPETLTIDVPIGVARHPRWKLMSASPQALAARPAITHVRVLRRLDGATLIEAAPWTGRLHQIRVHLAFVGHPVLWDEFYAEWGVLKGVPPAHQDRFASLPQRRWPEASGTDVTKASGHDHDALGGGADAQSSGATRTFHEGGITTPGAEPFALPRTPYVLVHRPLPAARRRDCDRFGPGDAPMRLHVAAEYGDARRAIVVFAGERKLDVFGAAADSRRLFGFALPEWDAPGSVVPEQPPRRPVRPRPQGGDAIHLPGTTAATPVASAAATATAPAIARAPLADDPPTDEPGSAERRVEPFLDRQALHAFRLVLRHPVTDAEMCFSAPLPADMCAALVALD